MGGLVVDEREGGREGGHFHSHGIGRHVTVCPPRRAGPYVVFPMLIVFVAPPWWRGDRNMVVG